MLLAKLVEALGLAAGMAWEVAWSLVLGFTLSGAVQALVSKEQMQRVLGRDGIREIALATGFGAASSSCSYRASRFCSPRPTSWSSSASCSGS
jgi:uncharacterized membrane protein YraQ (UPF0718 family)